jgi:hypothetical protein
MSDWALKDKELKMIGTSRRFGSKFWLFVKFWAIFKIFG